MKDNDKTKEQLINELTEMRQRIAELEVKESKPLSAKEEAAELYITLAESSHAGVYIVQNGKFRFINHNAAAYAGYSKEEILGTDSIHIVHPDDRKKAKENAAKMLKGESSSPYEFRIITRGGEIRWILKTVTPISYKGKPAVLSNSMDITDLKEANDTLKVSEAKYRTLVETTLDLVFTVDRRGMFTYINPRFVGVTGYTASDLTGRPFTHIVAPEQIESTVDRFKEGIRDNFIPPYEAHLIHKNGGRVTIEFLVTTLHDTDGEITGRFGIGRDITDRRRAEEKLRDSEERLNLALEVTSDALWDRNVETGEMYLSPRYYTMLGYEPYEMPPSYDTWTNLLHPDDRKRAINKVNKHIKGKSDSYDVEFRLRSKSGKWRWIRSRGKVVERNAGGSALRMVGTHVDITERKYAADKIKASLKEKEVLLQEVHHRVKNNMQVISSLLNLQAGYIKDAEALEMFKDSQNRVRSMALMHEKLYQSRNLASIDFSKYIRNLTNDLLRLYSVNTNAIKLKVDARDALLDINTAIPCGLIINELISNSLKHAFPNSRDGKISIKLHSDNDNKYTLVVSDNGIGLPENLDFKNTESLGLQLVNTLTDQLHGTIEVDGSGGTSVKIIFGEQATSNEVTFK